MILSHIQLIQTGSIRREHLKLDPLDLGERAADEHTPSETAM